MPVKRYTSLYALCTFILEITMLDTNNLQQRHSINRGKTTYTLASEKYGLSFHVYFSPPGTPSIHLLHKGGIMGDLQAVLYNCLFTLGKHKKKKKRGKRREQVQSSQKPTTDFFKNKLSGKTSNSKAILQHACTRLHTQIFYVNLSFINLLQKLVTSVSGTASNCTGFVLLVFLPAAECAEYGMENS